MFYIDSKGPFRRVQQARRNYAPPARPNGQLNSLAVLALLCAKTRLIHEAPVKGREVGPPVELRLICRTRIDLCNALIEFSRELYIVAPCKACNQRAIDRVILNFNLEPQLRQIGQNVPLPYSESQKSLMPWRTVVEQFGEQRNCFSIRQGLNQDREEFLRLLGMDAKDLVQRLNCTRIVIGSDMVLKQKTLQRQVAAVQLRCCIENGASSGLILGGKREDSVCLRGQRFRIQGGERHWIGAAGRVLYVIRLRYARCKTCKCQLFTG